jgi:tetratricopeptide (TPR) repeat protein
LGRICIERRHREFAKLFKVLHRILKRRGDKRLVLAVARLSLDAARRLPRTEEEAKLEAMTRICGEGWGLQRLNQLAEARAAAEDSLDLGRKIPWDRNTAFCIKCLGRLMRLQAEQETDAGEKAKLLSESERYINDAIRTFATVEDVGPADPEVGDCYSLLSRTQLRAGKRRDAEKSARKARELLTDKNSKDYLDYCILMGDIEASWCRWRDAVPYYEEVLTKVQDGDAEKSEIYARAYFARGKARLEMDEQAHAVLDFERSAKIWRELEDTYNASRADWAIIKETRGLKQSTIALLEKESFPVRVETYRLYEASSQGGSGKAIAHRAEPSKAGWNQLIRDARRNVAIQERHW